MPNPAHPDISTIIPTYRRPHTLSEAIESALAQTGPCHDVIVVDDDPKRSAEPIVQGFKGKVRYLPMPEWSQKRPARVRNTGWQHVKGKYIHFLDDDDRVPAGTYEAMFNALEKSGAGMGFGVVEPFGDDPDILEAQQEYFADAARRARLAKRFNSPKLMVANMLFKPTVLVNSACMVRRDCVEKLRGFDTECVVVEDVDFYIRAIRSFGFVFLDRVVLNYRTGAPSLMTDLQNNRPVVHSYDRIYENYRKLFGGTELFALKVFTRLFLR
jgi:glycosyltransferase involved in cell wall biosynthesis